MNPRILALIAAFSASFIYGVNHTIAKGLMPTVIQPYGFILLRVSGAAIVFWVISLFYEREKIDKEDWGRLILCAIFGMVLNMNMFFKGLELSTPINSSVVITLSPTTTHIVSINFKRTHYYFKRGRDYLGSWRGTVINFIWRKNPINIPIGWPQFSEVAWLDLGFTEIWQLIFVVIGTTVLTYLFNIYALKQLSPAVIGVFMYLQPLIAVIFAVITGSDSLSTIRIIAASFIFLGVYLATRKKKVTLMVDEV